MGISGRERKGGLQNLGWEEMGMCIIRSAFFNKRQKRRFLGFDKDLLHVLL